jgi:hypothetical protein
LDELKVKYVKPMRLNVDNKSSKESHCTWKVKAHRKEMKFHFLGDQVGKEKLNVVNCRTEVQVADILIKPLKADKFKELRKMVGIIKVETLD